MVAFGTTRGFVKVHGTTDGRQWVSLDDYNALVERTRLSEAEVLAMYYHAAIVRQMSEAVDRDKVSVEIVARDAAHRAVFAELIERLIG